MKNNELQNCLANILKNDMINYVDAKSLIRNHPDYPNISKIKLTPENISLTEDEMDNLNDGKLIEVSCEILGAYDKTSADKNATRPNNGFKLVLNSLQLKIENDLLVISDCNCYTSVG